ncbi:MULTISPECIES: Tar ligand binding domain-containing protein [unclassified Paraburkholderia]|uniref:Tar ligand binding domain-containing protein n=1 Tax=unclassified Paraburkholderia TaxID=2615204 RepID=UPI00161D69E1|nr:MULTISPECIES: Tar ligand binding domain-containing protein [unclassified Paraburkholderia]MBB5448059.1 hypothetical protein [Paraburkholderia sp. WSM4177]MBB5488474.1 hypothetical protein [Paraburkholderia sp. WSM4180]
MFDGITIKSRLTIPMAFLCLLLTGTGMLGPSSIGRVNASLKAVYETRLVQAHDVTRIATIVHGPMESLYAPVQDGLDGLIAMQMEAGQHEYERLQAAYGTVRLLSVAAVAVGGHRPDQSRGHADGRSGAAELRDGGRGRERRERATRRGRPSGPGRVFIQHGSAGGGLS